MMSRDLKSGLFFLLFSLLVFYECSRIGIGIPSKPGSGFLAFCAGVVLFGLSFRFIYRGWRIREPRTLHSPKLIAALAVVLAYAFALEVAGFMPATFPALAVLFRLQTSRSWWTILGGSALVTLLAYLVFGVLLRVFFPPGVFGI